MKSMMMVGNAYKHTHDTAGILEKDPIMNASAVVKVLQIETNVSKE